MEKNKNIVVIDDAGDLRKTLSELFRDSDINIVPAKSDRDDLNRKLGFDDYLIVINETGLNDNLTSLVAYLNGRFLFCITPIIIASGNADLLKKGDMMEVPIVNYIHKPFNTAALRHHWTNILETIESNRDLVALTGLPGNKVINRRLFDTLKRGDDFAMMYIDLDNFKEYNEYYGFFQGDKVLLFMADILYSVLRQYSSGTDFIGHVGGDDFIVILDDPSKVKVIGDSVIKNFDANISKFYATDDLKNNYIETRNRAGEIERINIMTVSIIVITADEFRTTPIDSIYKKMMIYKKQAKMVKGSVVIQN
ncbi:MAG: diguanylate cyclase [Muribaculaceae bacterium]|nr:diguanylate cyclase [Muribaculaceae bacterium]